MKKWVLLTLSSFLHLTVYSQDTFSICAYDSVTGQLGSAGATCIQGTLSAIIISDVIPGNAVVHTQASWIQANQTYAHNLMFLGLTPSQIIDSLTANDVQGNPNIRQYGVVDVTGASAAYTGSACLVYHNHITGPGYSIQGNILLGQQILDSMESKFLNTTGDLSCRLMAALQGAKVSGADTRCSSLGISSVSAFIRVANPSDTGSTPFYLDISINTYPNYTEPIDSLQQRFNLWGGCGPNNISSARENQSPEIFPNPAGEKLTIDSKQRAITSIGIANLLGVPQRFDIIYQETGMVSSMTEIDISCLPPGIYFLRLFTVAGEIISRKIVRR